MRFAWERRILEAALATKSNYAPGFAAKLLVDALLWRRRLGDRAIDSTRIRALGK
jgi:hypothetical protein